MVRFVGFHFGQQFILELFMDMKIEQFAISFPSQMLVLQDVQKILSLGRMNLFYLHRIRFSMNLIL